MDFGSCVLAREVTGYSRLRYEHAFGNPVMASLQMVLVICTTALTDSLVVIWRWDSRSWDKLLCYFTLCFIFFFPIGFQCIIFVVVLVYAI